MAVYRDYRLDGRARAFQYRDLFAVVSRHYRRTADRAEFRHLVVQPTAAKGIETGK